LHTDRREATKADTAASDACTRSGTFALALSAVLFMLVASWAHRRSEVALAQYLSYRYDLALSIGSLDENPVWQKFKDSNEASETTPLNRLPVQVPVITSGLPITDKKIRSDHVVSIHKPHGPGWRPSAPTALTVTQMVEIPQIHDAIDILKKLNDASLLTESRKYSNYFAFSIGRWAQKRTDLIYRNAVGGNCATKEIEKPHASNVSAEFVPEIDEDVLLACLNINDVRDLAQFEQPAMTNPDQIGGLIRRDIDIAPGTLPKDLFLASIVSQAFLFVALAYFGAFTKEATLSEGFPVEGTFFSAFSRSHWTLLLLFFAIFIPPFSALSVAFESGYRTLWAGGILISGEAVWIVLILQRTYWTLMIRRKLTKR
jgi:hypothetical protein